MLYYNYDVFYEQKEIEMENSLNENFTLSKEQIRFIDDGVINNGKNLNDVVEELVKQDDNNFQEKDVAQIIELYKKIRKQKMAKLEPKRNRNEWSQEQEEKLQKALEEEIKKKGEDININALAKELKETGLFKPHSKCSITIKLYELANKSEEYRRIKPKQNRKDWPQEQEEKLQKALEKKLKKKVRVLVLII